MIQGRTICIALLVVAIAALVPANGAAAKKKASPITEISGSSPSVFGNKAIATATAVCPPGRRVVGGGFLQSVPILLPGPSQGSIYESVKVGQNAWRVSSQLFANQPTDRLDLTAFAYCRRGAPKTTTAVTTAPQPNGPALGTPVTATCSGKKKAVAGGFSTPPPFTTPGNSTIVIDSLRSAPKAWSSRLMALAGGNPLSSYAYCAKQKRALPSRSIVSTLASVSGSSATAAAPCFGKTRPAAGGFSEPQAAASVPAMQLGVLIPYESRRIAATRSWQVSGLFAGSPPGTIVSTAYCG